MPLLEHSAAGRGRKEDGNGPFGATKVREMAVPLIDAGFAIAITRGVSICAENGRSLNTLLAPGPSGI
jgi:hypothetical protein